jgi:PAS domain S-box-containing protein
MDNDQALRESEYRYRNLFQAMAASFWELDFSGVGASLRQLRKEGVTDYAAYFERHPEFVREMMRATRVLDVNEQTVTLFGGAKADLLTSVDPFWPETSNAVFAASVVAAVSGKPNYSAETKLRRLDGSELDAQFTACFPPDSVAKGILLIGVIDITERKQANERLRRLQADFAHAARVSMLGELTASIAHEVNQPLAAIATNASAGLRWLNRPTPDIAEVRALTTNIVADAKRAADIIARIRGMASARAPDQAPVAINGVVHEALQFLHHELQAQGATVSLDLAGALPPVTGDRTQLQQLLVNLIINAAQSMANISRREINIATRLAAPDTIEVTVRDSGPGIAPENLDRLFKSFFSTKADGMGMGLPICRSIVETHGGGINGANNPAGGACFTVTLPAKQLHTNV